jgi:hypothetical protein
MPWALPPLPRMPALTSYGQKLIRRRDRARAQHLGEMERHAVSIVAAQSAVRNHFRQLVSAADGVRANLPKHLKGHVQEGLTNQLTADSLRFLAEVSAFGMSQDGIPAPGCTRAPRNAHTIDNWSGDWPGLLQLISRITEPLKRLSDPPSPLSPGDTGGAGVARALAGVAIPADPSSDGRIEPTPATPSVEIAPAVPPVGVGAPVAAEASSLGSDVAAIRRPSFTGVVVRNGVMTDQTSRQISPEAYSEPAEAIEGEEGINDAPEEIVAPAPSRTPAYTEASEAF